MSERISFEEVRFQVVMQRVLDHYGIAGRKCPFCGNKSFSAYEGGKGYQCFACVKKGRPEGKGGCFDLVMRLEKCDLKTAAARLRDMFSGPAPAPRTLRYFEELDTWLDNLVVLQEDETPEEWAERVRATVKSRILESYKNGEKKAKAPAT